VHWQSSVGNFNMEKELQTSQLRSTFETIKRNKTLNYDLHKSCLLGMSIKNLIKIN